MEDQVDERVKSERSRILIAEAEKVQRRFLEKCCGTVRRVLFEQEENGMMTGYTDNYIKVYIPDKDGAQAASAGDFADVCLSEPYLDGMIGSLRP